MMLSRHARRVLATLATLALPSAAAAQGRPASASVSATATVMPVCRIERVGDADSTRAADGTLELTLHVHGASNAPWRLLAIALPGGDAGSTDTARVRAADGTWLPLAPGEPVVVARTR
ncbi:MAG TPA: hypothetical protein VFS44_05780, partial [Gemmatimonadaceae bacterium]|nr:hypothetical protein [Gemmatimonadaceae bacterium]